MEVNNRSQNIGHPSALSLQWRGCLHFFFSLFLFTFSFHFFFSLFLSAAFSMMVLNKPPETLKNISHVHEVGKKP